MTKVFIDGSAGTTGLRIRERLASREDLEILVLPEELRKDTNARKEALNSADVAFLCLPDAAAIEAVDLISSKKTVVIDTSTAHRTNDGWEYGLPELKGRREKIADSKRIANPGCHATGFIALVEPLISTGVLSSDTLLTCHSITGYSGGGKQMIAQYQQEDADKLLKAPRQYGITQQHKHLKEMMKICGLDNSPIFCPIVSDFYSGMEVTVPIFKSQLKCSADDIKQIYNSYYASGLIKYKDSADEQGFLSACSMADRDDMEISVHGSEDRIILVSRFDNLGKGASGAAIQNMNLILGKNEAFGLNV